MLRVAKGLKQSDLAKALDIETSNYNRFENRGNKLTIEQVERIADALGVTLGELLGYKDTGTTKEVETLRQGVKDLEKEIFDLKAENKMLQKHNEILFGSLATQRELITRLMGNQEGIEKFKDMVTGGNPDNEERMKQAATTLFPDIAQMFNPSNQSPTNNPDKDTK